MTVVTTGVRTVAQGNGSTSVFSYKFKLDDPSHLVVLYTDANGGVSPPISPSLYALTGVGVEGGGTVQYPLSGPPIATGTTLTMVRQVPLQQQTDLVSQAGFFPESVEGAFDYEMMALQQLADDDARSLAGPVTDPTTLDMELPSAVARAGKVLVFDANGQPTAMALQTAAPIVAQVASISALKAITGQTSDEAVNVLGYYAEGDGGGGVFYWNAGSSASDNGGTIIASNAGGTGRWVRSITTGGVNLRWFGAKGDGVADDAAAVQAVINFGAKLIYGSQGDTYLLGAAGLQFATLTGVRFVGNGATLKFNAAPAQTMPSGSSTQLLITSCTDCEISGWTINGNSKATNAIGLSASTDCRITGNRISACGVEALIFGESNTRTTYGFNTLFSAIGSAKGIWAGNTNASQQETDVQIVGNNCHDNPGDGIVATIYGGRIAANDCVSNGASGITLTGYVATGVISHDVTIVGNVCRSNAFHGVQLGDVVGWADSTSSTYNNTVTGNVCRLNTHTGVYGVQNRDSVIADNVCLDNVDAGIVIGQTVRTTISGNVCFDSRAGGSRSQQQGILILAQVAALDTQDIIVNGNLCYNNTADGMQVTTAASGTMAGICISGNIYRANSRNGLRVLASGTTDITGVVVTGNTALGNTTADVMFDLLDVVFGANKFVSVGGTIGMFYGFTDGATTPSVKGRPTFFTQNTNPTSITNLLDGQIGQEVTIIFGDGNTTLVDGGHLLLAGNMVGTLNDSIKLISNGTDWFELSRSVN